MFVIKKVIIMKQSKNDLPNFDSVNVNVAQNNLKHTLDINIETSGASVVPKNHFLEI